MPAPVSRPGLGGTGQREVARLNPQTGEIEDLDVLFFSTRPLRGDVLELPVAGSLRLVATKSA
jgi:hypothetical protein